MTYRTIDLCCGIGGIRRGFELASSDFATVLSADIDAKARCTYQHLFREDRGPLGDIGSEEFVQAVLGLEDGYDILLAGFPCQAFSIAGKRLGFEDATRGTVFFDIANIVSKTKPKAIFLENVANLISHDKGKTFKTIVRVLENDLNYKVIGIREDCGFSASDSKMLRGELVRNSRDFGLPQNRPRIYIIAFSRDRYGELVNQIPNHLPTKRADKPIFEDVYDIMEDVVDDKYYLAEGLLSTLRKHRETQKSKGFGFGYKILNEDGNQHPISCALLATGGSGRERNLVKQEKAGVAGKRLPSRKTPLNGEGIRYLTPTEWGRLQGFIGYGFLRPDGTDGFSFPPGLSDGQQYKQFGNSVTIPVIEEMAKYMHACLRWMDFELESKGETANPFTPSLMLYG